MSEGKNRRMHTSEFKTKQARRQYAGGKAVMEIEQKFNPVLEGPWMRNS